MVDKDLCLPQVPVLTTCFGGFDIVYQLYLKVKDMVQLFKVQGLCRLISQLNLVSSLANTHMGTVRKEKGIDDSLYFQLLLVFLM